MTDQSYSYVILHCYIVSTNKLLKNKGQGTLFWCQSTLSETVRVYSSLEETCVCKI